MKKGRIQKLLRDLRDSTPCDEESTNCGCEKFDEIIDLVDQKVFYLYKLEDMKKEVEQLIKLITNPIHLQDSDSEDYISDGEMVEIVLKKLIEIVDYDEHK